MWLARNCCPRKYEPVSVMIASRFGVLNSTCAVRGLTSSRSIVQWLLVSVYEPVILRLLAASRLPAASLLRVLMVARPSPNGRSHAASNTRAASATATLAPAFNTAFVTAGVSSPLPQSGPTQHCVRSSPTERAGGGGRAHRGPPAGASNLADPRPQIPGHPAQHSRRQAACRGGPADPPGAGSNGPWFPAFRGPDPGLPCHRRPDRIRGGVLQGSPHPVAGQRSADRQQHRLHPAGPRNSARPMVE